MKGSLKKQIDHFQRRKQSVLDHFDKVGYSKSNVTEYAAISLIPLYVLYYFLYESGIDEAYDNMVRLCEYYQLEVDIEI